MGILNSPTLTLHSPKLTLPSCTHCLREKNSLSRYHPLFKISKFSGMELLVHLFWFPYYFWVSATAEVPHPLPQTGIMVIPSLFPTSPSKPPSMLLSEGFIKCRSEQLTRVRPYLSSYPHSHTGQPVKNLCCLAVNPCWPSRLPAWPYIVCALCTLTVHTVTTLTHQVF